MTSWSDHGRSRSPIGIRRAIAVFAAVIEELALAALVVLRMASGTHQQFDKGVAPLGAS